MNIITKKPVLIQRNNKKDYYSSFNDGSPTFDNKNKEDVKAFQMWANAKDKRLKLPENGMWEAVLPFGSVIKIPSSTQLAFNMYGKEWSDMMRKAWVALQKENIQPVKDSQQEVKTEEVLPKKEKEKTPEGMSKGLKTGLIIGGSVLGLVVISVVIYVATKHK